MTNIAEILKHAPQGLWLYSPLVGSIEFQGVSSNNEILTKSSYVFDEFGRFIWGDASRGEV